MAESKSVVELLAEALRLLCEPTDENLAMVSVLLVEARRAAQAEAEVRRWVPVGERLPEPCEWVLARWHGIARPGVVAFLNGGWIQGGLEVSAPALWMAIPDPNEPTTVPR